MVLRCTLDARHKGPMRAGAGLPQSIGSGVRAAPVVWVDRALDSMGRGLEIMLLGEVAA